MFDGGSKEIVTKDSVDTKSREFFGKVLLKRGIKKCGRIWGGDKRSKEGLFKLRDNTACLYSDG